MMKSVNLSNSVLAARGESPKMGTVTDFWQSSFLRNKALRRTKIGWQSPFFVRDHFYHGLLGRSLTWIWTFHIAVAMAGVAWAANSPKKQVAAQTTPKAAVQTGAAKENLANGRDASKTISIQLAPSEVDLWGRNASQRFLVIGRFADGMERDLTARSSFTISNPKLAEVSPHGRVVALADGETFLEAEVSGRAVRAKVRIKGSDEKRPFSFGRDIGGIFTKKGCSDSHCHGSVKGKGGFKLSMNALHPRDDYQWIIEGGAYQVLTAEPGGERIPRIDLGEPENSLLLQKPAFTVPHGGGQVLPVGSVDYETILNWIRSGAPFGVEGGESAKITGLQVFPKEFILDSNGKQHLLVTAEFSNGRREDFSDQVMYSTNNAEVVKVSSEGLVEAVKRGETSVIIRAPEFTVSARVGVVAEPISDYPSAPQKNFIDDHVFAKLRKFHIVPSELSSDSEFVRRVCLDLTGTLPPPDRVREFLTSGDPQKRERLIEILLHSPEYVDYWTFRFSDLFRVALYAAGFSPNKAHPYWTWIRDSIEKNKPYDQIAIERVAAQGTVGPAAHYMPGEFQPYDNMAEQIRVFMGRRLDCAQCHNHPYETWSQNQFWGLAAFFGGLSRIGGVLADVPGGGFAKGGTTGPARPMLHPRTKVAVKPAFLDGKVLPHAESADLRMELANWMTRHPYFAEAAVNRMWSYFFGRGIVDPVDDFRSTDPATHPELLEALADDFRQNKHDLKHLMRTIVQSRTYQLSNVPNETNKDDTINYSRSWPRALDAEVLLDAISVVSGVPESFARASGAGGKDPMGARAINIKDTDSYASRFLDMYGRTDRMMVPERDRNANLTQALHMLVGTTYTDKLSEEGSRIDRWMRNGASDKEIIEELCLAGLSRFPSEEEIKVLGGLIQNSPSRRRALEDLMWGLITSREFAYKH